MRRIEAAHRYDVPADRGFAFVTDPANWPRFWPGYVALDERSRWAAHGDTARLTTRLLGRERMLTMTIVALEPNRLVTYTSTQPGLPDAFHERHFEAADHGFVYRLVVEYEPRAGIAGVLDRALLPRGIRRAFRQTFAALERFLLQDSPTPSTKGAALEKVSETVHHLPEITGGPTIILGETVTIVDTGVPGSEDAILAAVEELGRSRDEVADIVLTHADGDHVGSLAALAERTGATVWAGAHEADVIEGKAPTRGGDVNQSGSVDRRFEPGETLALHGGIETVACHGHTAGHVALFLPGERILIAGDAIFNRDGLSGSPPQNTADAADARAAVSTLAALRPETIVFGHGPSIVGGAAEQLDELDRSLG